MSALGQKAASADDRIGSALIPRADIGDGGCDVGFGPRPDISSASSLLLPEFLQPAKIPLERALDLVESVGAKPPGGGGRGRAGALAGAA